MTNMRNKHTPGPWGLDIDNPELVISKNGKGIYDYIAEIDPVNDNGDQTIHNSKLIVASPELLQVCRCALADLESIMPEFEPGGDRGHPGWRTMAELEHVLQKIDTK